MLKSFLLFLFLALANSLILSEALVLSQNSISSNGNWLLGKMFSAAPLQGDLESFFSRAPLARNKFDLGAFYGYQQLTSKRTPEIDEIQFSFFISDKAYLDFFYAGPKDNLDGIRVSSRKDFPGLIYSINSDGRFTRYQENEKLFVAPGMHKVRVHQVDSKIEIYLDGNLVLENLEKTITPFFTFRGGLEKVEIHRVETFLKERPVWVENFRLNSVWEKIFPKIFVSFLLIGLIFALMNFFFPTRLSLGLMNRIFMSVLFTASTWLCFDYFYYSKIPTAFHGGKVRAINPTFAFINFELARSTSSEFLLRLLDARISPPLKDYRSLSQRMALYVCEDANCVATFPKDIKYDEPKKDEFRLLMVGGSLWMGAGVSTYEQTTFALLYQHIYKNIKSAGLHISGLNASSAGDPTAIQSEKFLTAHYKFKPDVILSGLMHLESDSEMDGLEKLLKYAHENGITFVFLKRPYNPEHTNLFQKLVRTDPLLEKYGAVSIDVNELTIQPSLKEKGNLWWDGYHLTPYGNELMAEFIYPKLWSVIKAKLDEKFPSRAEGLRL